MGLGISQVRLLALTHRKSDIELEMSIDSKRKQQLTRKSTELSHTYYSRLNNYNYQYSTTAGFNDLDYNYLMGETSGGKFTERFLNQIIYGGNDVAQKNDNNVILTDNKGKVVLNDELANLVYSMQVLPDDTLCEVMQLEDDEVTVADKTAFAINSFIKAQSTNTAYHALTTALTGSIDDGNSALTDPEIVNIIKMIMDLGGVQSGGTVYIDNGGTVTKGTTVSGSLNGYSANEVEANAIDDPNARQANFEAISGETFYLDESLETKTTLKKGYCYTVCASSSDTVKKANGERISFTRSAPLTNVQNCLWDGEKFVPNLTANWLQYLTNIVSYLAPQLSAAIQNGCTTMPSLTQYTGDYSYDYNGTTYSSGRLPASYLAAAGVTSDTADVADPDNPGSTVHLFDLMVRQRKNEFVEQCAQEFQRTTSSLYPGGYKPRQFRMLQVIAAKGGNAWCFAAWTDATGAFHSDWAPNEDFNKLLWQYNNRTTSWFGTIYPAIPSECPISGGWSHYYGTSSQWSERVKDYTWTDDMVNATLQDGEFCCTSGRCYMKVGGILLNIDYNTYSQLVASQNGQSNVFKDVQDIETLQNGLKSGVYQLSMVDSVKTGAYHKNTTMDYFIHRNLCVEKIDVSKREELTAWYNAEQAALSNQENYWDEEITNLSTELTSVNQEIESVKNLKSNAIKSVFNWGGS